MTSAQQQFRRTNEDQHNEVVNKPHKIKVSKGSKQTKKTTHKPSINQTNKQTFLGSCFLTKLNDVTARICLKNRH